MIDVEVAGGRAVNTGSGFAMHYYTTDHLGSVRLVTDASGNILEQFDYLPYGERCINSNLAVANSGKTDYLYGGKELPQLFGIDWYDSVARWQTTSGVFSSPDPLMEKYYSVSPYSYCAGNPINYVDSQGDSLIITKTGEYLEMRGNSSDVYYFDGEKLCFIGNLGEVINVDEVFQNLINLNSFISAHIGPLLFYLLVKGHGPWDLKNNEKTIWGIAKRTNTKLLFHDTTMSAEDIGNMHYGIMAAATLWCNLDMAQRMAGYAQRRAGTSNDQWNTYEQSSFFNASHTTGAFISSTTTRKPPYGDDPEDQKWIQQGYNLIKKK